MGKDNRQLFEYTLRLADDALVMGQRLAEWCSKGPFLEEDIALSNVALDHLGRARLLYDLASTLDAQKRTEDQLAMMRQEHEYRNLLLYELPRGNFAFTIARQYLSDQFNLLFMQQLCNSQQEQLAAVAAKAIKESEYHLRRSKSWMLRLGDGTEQSHDYLQEALEQLWDYTEEMFAMDELESGLRQQRIAVDREALRKPWQREVEKLFAEATIKNPEGSGWVATGGRAGVHTEHMGFLLTELQYMQRTWPNLQW